MMRWFIRDGIALRWVTAGVLSLALVGALGATANQAFAAKRVEMSNESTFQLGHVAVECAVATSETEAGEEHAFGDDAFESYGEVDGGMDGHSDQAWSLEGEELTMGAPRMRTYVLTNKGEAAYVRLSSRTMLGGLSHVNDDSVNENGTMGDVDADEPGGSIWTLSSDGFWYRNEPLASGESIIVSVSVQVPFSQAWIDALSTGEASEVVETIEVEAMQARNATIDIDAARPWGEGGVRTAAFSTEGTDLDSDRAEGER